MSELTIYIAYYENGVIEIEEYHVNNVEIGTTTKIINKKDKVKILSFFMYFCKILLYN